MVGRNFWLCLITASAHCLRLLQALFCRLVTVIEKEIIVGMLLLPLIKGNLPIHLLRSIDVVKMVKSLCHACESVAES